MYARKKYSKNIIIYKTSVQFFVMVILFIMLGAYFAWLSFGLIKPIFIFYAKEPWSKACQVDRFYYPPTRATRSFGIKKIPTIILLNVHIAENKYYHDRYKMAESRYIHNEFKRDDFICLKGKTWFLGTKIIDEIKMHSKLSTLLYCNNEVLFQPNELITKQVSLNEIDSIFLKLMSTKTKDTFFSIIYKKHIVLEFTKKSGRVEMSYAISSPDFIKHYDYMTQWSKDNNLYTTTKTRDGLNFSTISIPDNTPNVQINDNGEIKEYNPEIYLLLLTKEMMIKLGSISADDVVESVFLKEIF